MTPQNYIEVGGLRWSPELLTGASGVVNPANGISYFMQPDAVAEAEAQGLLVPTAKQYEQLYKRTTHKWTKQGGLPGMLFTDKKNGNTLFFPASGYRHASNGSFYNVGRLGYYWSGSVYNATLGFLLYFTTTNVYPQDTNYRSFGFPVRCLVP